MGYPLHREWQDGKSPMVTRVHGCIVSTVIDFRPFRFFVTNPEEEIQKYHFAGGFYEAEELQIVQRFYRHGTIFADIGANIGNHAIYAEKVLDAPEIVVFEPNPVAVAHMDINFLLNDCRRINRDYLGFPVADRMGQPMAISFSPGNNIGNTMFANAPDGAFRTITGDFALARRPVGFIKIDVEEMEFEVLAGLEETIATWRPVLFMEVLESRLPELQAWATARSYRIAESHQRYPTVRNHVLTPA